MPTGDLCLQMTINSRPELGQQFINLSTQAHGVWGRLKDGRSMEDARGTAVRKNGETWWSPNVM